MLKTGIVRAIFGVSATAALLAGCAGSPSAAAPTNASELGPAGHAATATLSWQPTKLGLGYHRERKAKLTYYNAPYQTKLSCPPGVTVDAFLSWDDGAKAGYTFTAETRGPSNCKFTATLKGSESQSAVLALHIR